MPPGTAPPRLLLAAGGAAWESRLLPLLAAAASPVVLARRCVDVPDLAAAAAAGQGNVAVVAADLPDLDADVVAGLAEAGVVVIAVAAAAATADRMGRLGVCSVLDVAEVAADPAVVVTTAAAVADGVSGPPAAGRVVEAARLTPVRASTEQGRLVAVWGPTGAPGRSTVALGLAAASAGAGTETMLVDADVYGGATAQMLAVLDEVSGVLAAARSAATGSLDERGLAESARQVAPRLRVLTGLPRADRWTAMRPAAVRGVLARAQQAVRLVVVDCGFCLEQDEELSFDTAAPRRNGATVAVLEDADMVLVVGTADPLGLARLARARHELRERLPSAQVRLVVNRVRGGLGWSRNDVSRTLLQAIGEVPLAYLPLDQEAVDTCWISGRTLPEAAPRSALSVSMDELAAAVGGELGLAPGVRRRALRR